MNRRFPGFIVESAITLSLDVILMGVDKRRMYAIQAHSTQNQLISSNLYFINIRIYTLMK